MIITSPLKIPVSSKKSFSLNLNQYRNTHFLVLNKAKNNYSDLMLPKIQEIEPMEQVELFYTLYPATRHKQDIMNVCSIVDKFFCDVLVKGGVIPDDTYEQIPKTHYSFGEIDKENPRVEIEIRKLK